MIVYNELSQTADYKVIGGDDWYLVEDLDPEEKVIVDKKVGDGVKIGKDESPGLDDYSIDIGMD